MPAFHFFILFHRMTHNHHFTHCTLSNIEVIASVTQELLEALELFQDSPSALTRVGRVFKDRVATTKPLVNNLLHVPVG